MVKDIQKVFKFTMVGLIALCLVLFCTMAFNPGVARAEGEHTAGTALTGTESTLAPGDYYLTGDVTMKNQLVVGTGTVNLYLNGHMLTLCDGMRGIHVDRGATLNLNDYDTASASPAVHKFTASSEAPYLWTLDEAAGDKTVTGGVIYGGKAVTTAYCGAIEDFGTINMNGGNIIGTLDTYASTDSNESVGGAVYVNASGTFNMNAGSIQGNAANGTFTYSTGSSVDGAGGGICSYGNCTIGKDAVVSYNYSNFVGGGVSSHDRSGQDGASLTVDGEVSHNSAPYGGGIDNIGQITIGATAVVSYNTAQEYGGGFFTHKDGTEVVINGQISHNSAACGGGMYNQGSGCTFTISANGALDYNEADSGGGYYDAGSSTKLTVAGSVSHNTAESWGGGIDSYGASDQVIIGFSGKVDYNEVSNDKDNGGGIYIGREGSVCTIDGEVSHNTAGYGGGIYNGVQSKTVISGYGRVSYNTARYVGGGLINENGCTLVNYGSIDHNSATGTGSDCGGGGVMNCAGGTFINVKDAVISDNTAGGCGGGYWGCLLLNYNTDTATSRNEGTISGNTAAQGGGVALMTNSTKTVDDTFINTGTITGNTATAQGGGIYYDAGNLAMSYAAKVSDNTAGEAKAVNNVYLPAGRTITVTSNHFVSGAAIGVTTEQAATADGAQKFATGASAEDAPYFTADNAAGAVVSHCDGVLFSPAILGTGAAEADTLWFGMKAAGPSLSYEVHGQNYGWDQGWVMSPATAGTTGQALQAEAIKISDSDADLKLSYRVHVQNIGWMNWVDEGEQAGTTGRALRMEALQVKTSGADAAKYTVQYRVHVRNIGWMDWVDANTSAYAGTTHQGLRAEAVQIRIVEK